MPSEDLAATQQDPKASLTLRAATANAATLPCCTRATVQQGSGRTRIRTAATTPLSPPARYRGAADPGGRSSGAVRLPRRPHAPSGRHLLRRLRARHPGASAAARPPLLRPPADASTPATSLTLARQRQSRGTNCSQHAYYALHQALSLRSRRPRHHPRTRWRGRPLRIEFEPSRGPCRRGAHPGGTRPYASRKERCCRPARTSTNAIRGTGPRR